MDRETYLLHQVHPAKLAADASASVISTWLFWRGRCLEAVVSALALPMVASVVVTHRDCSWLKGTTAGRYVLAHMPPWAQAVRLGGCCADGLRQLEAPSAAHRPRPAGGRGRLVQGALCPCSVLQRVLGACIQAIKGSMPTKVR